MKYVICFKEYDKKEYYDPDSKGVAVQDFEDAMKFDKVLKAVRELPTAIYMKGSANFTEIGIERVE